MHQEIRFTFANKITYVRYVIEPNIDDSKNTDQRSPSVRKPHSMKLEIKSKGSRQGKRAGRTLYYAYPTKREKISLQELIRLTSERCHLSPADLEIALRSAATVVCECIEQGQGVDLGEMGTLMPFVQGKLMDSPEEVTPSSLQPAKLMIHPKKNIREALGRLQCEILPYTPHIANK